MRTSEVLLESNIPDLTPRRGKVRDTYSIDDELLAIVTTDRISAFDWVLPNGIPGKGKVLNGLTAYWLIDKLTRHIQNFHHHLISTDVSQFGDGFHSHAKELAGRSMLCRRLQMFPVECVVRGYLAGSGWKEYRTSQSVCGIPLRSGLIESEELPEPIFTPATKAEAGHDENISFDRMAQIVGGPAAEELRSKSLEVYRIAHRCAMEKRLIIADTKLEWGITNNGNGKVHIVLGDEVLTPDSSRYWPKEGYKPGGGQPSFDKQYVRDWLEQSGWDKNSPPPRLPDNVVEGTQQRYIEAYDLLTSNGTHR